MKKLLALMVCLLALAHSVGATVYTSSGNKSWSASGFPSWIVASDTINIVNSDTVTIGNDIRIFGQVNVDSLCMITGNRVIKVEGTGSLNNYGTIEITQQIHIDGDVYNYNQMNVLNVHNDGYINNSGEIKLDSAQEFEHHGGEIDGCGTVLTDLLRVYENTTVALNGDNAAYIYCQNFCNTQGLDTPNFSGLLTLTEFLNNSDTANCKVGNDAELCFAGILPVELISFEVVQNGHVAQLSWVTASEYQNKGFEIMRSEDGVIWESLGFIQGAGESQEWEDYHFTDREPLKNLSYYKLKQIDLNESVNYSDMIHFMYRASSSLSIYPNPAERLLYVECSGMDVRHVSVTDLYGVVQAIDFVGEAASPQDIVKLEVHTLNPGVYFLVVGNRRVKFIRS